MRSVVLISVDTLRADRLGCYGYERETSPAIDEFARGGTLFENVVAQSPWTLPSHATMLTGLLPNSHGITSGASKLPVDAPTLASMLRDAGFVTGAIVNAPFLSAKHGIERGFDSFEAVPFDRKRGTEITDRALAWLRERQGERAFLFVHYYDVHSSYTPALKWRELFVRPYAGKANGSTSQLLRFRRGEFALGDSDIRHVSDLYDAEIRELDHELARLFDALAADGETLVVLTSDHGEAFLEHGDVLHGRTMYREMLGIPLVMRGPGVPIGLRVDTLAMLTDVMPTVLGRVDVRTHSVFDGVDLFEPGALAKHRFAFAMADHNNESPNIKWMVRDERFKLHYDALAESARLFDLALDPSERNDVAGTHPEILERLLQRLTLLRTRSRDAPAVEGWTEEELRELRELGY